MKTPFLEVCNLCFSYDNKQVLNNVSLQISRGEVFCLLGPNGSGKTTLLDCLLRLNKAETGNILIDGRSIPDMHPSEIARLLAYIPQSHQKNFPFSVFDIVLMGRTAYTGFFESPSAEDRSKVENILEQMNMQDIRNRDYTRLSGGESQLVLIMRAIVQEAPVLIMDEPASHLDFRNEMRLLEMIINIISEGSRSVLLTTHSPYIPFFLENRDVNVRTGLIENGRIIKTGKPSEILNSENIRRVFGVETVEIEHIIKNGSLKSIIPIKSSQEHL